MITIQVAGIEETREVFAKLVPRAQSSAIAKLAKAVHDDVETAIGRHTKTGAMLQSLRWIKRDGEHRIYHDLQRAPHAAFVHWGTRPHVIKPSKRKALRWTSGGRYIFARFVNHPGYKGDPYFVAAVDQAPKHFARIIAALRRELP